MPAAAEEPITANRALPPSAQLTKLIERSARSKHSGAKALRAQVDQIKEELEYVARVDDDEDVWKAALIKAITRGAESFLLALWAEGTIYDDGSDEDFVRFEVHGRYLVDHAVVREKMHVIPALLRGGAFMSIGTLTAFKVHTEVCIACFKSPSTAFGEMWAQSKNWQVCCHSSDCYHTIGGAFTAQPRLSEVVVKNKTYQNGGHEVAYTWT